MDVSLLSWNVGRSDLLEQVSAEPVDVALLQEVPRPPTSGSRILPRPGDVAWQTEGWKRRTWRTAIMQVSQRVTLAEIPIAELSGPGGSDLAVSRPGTLTAADVLVDGEVCVTVVSWYATWEHPPGDTRLLGADAGAHRLLSDVSALVDHDRSRRLVIAGDLNLLYGYGEHGHPYWAARYQTVFDRAAAIGLEMVGPQAPNGRQAEPWPAELPADSRNVPTFHTKQQGPKGATRQLDFVFASRSISDRVTVAALNEVDDWGPSDHCRIRIEVRDL